MAGIILDYLSKRFPGQDTDAVSDLSLTVDDGEFLVLVGPSGCGKSTTLRMIAGLEEPTAGTISIGGTVVDATPPGKRDLAMVFQSAATLPHLTVAENIGFGLRLRRVTKAETSRRVAAVAGTLGLAGLLDRRPDQLSGGQRQRVAIARAIIREPRAFLMDEPLSSLDARLRVQLRTEIARLQRALRTTTVYVTHDQAEAMSLGHRVAVLRDGRLEQVAPPRELYTRPANTFVASFIGDPPMNLWAAPVREGVVEVAGHRVVVAGGRTEATVGVRPADLRVGGPDAAGMAVEILAVEHRGADAMAYFGIPGGPELCAVATRPDAPVREGSRVSLTVDATDVHLFDSASGARL
ncbi:MAG: ABC transporter ATP-binding protein [Actinobacteria bacterium]|nr:ABC transporter ATP-binding protein [Actinomycetota bacterium]